VTVSSAEPLFNPGEVHVMLVVLILEISGNGWVKAISIATVQLFESDTTT
jgi:hypothetical protein